MTGEEQDRLTAQRGQGFDGDLTRRFTYHPPTPEQPEVYSLVRDLAHLFALLVEATSPPSRERSLAVTHIEEAVMWANAGIARRGLSDGAYAGAGDLLSRALVALDDAKPGCVVSAVVNVPVENLIQGDDPWPPDGHVTPLLEPLPASRAVDVLRSGLTLLAGLHQSSIAPAAENCPACWAQLILNGQPIPGPQASTDHGDAAEHPTEWAAVCPFCPAYIRTEGHGAQRDAQEWVIDHAKQVHGKDLR